MRGMTRIIGLLAAILWLLPGNGVSAAEVKVGVNHLSLSITAEGNLHVTEQYMLQIPEDDSIDSLAFPLPLTAIDVHYGSGIDEEKVQVEEGRLVLNQEIPSGEATFNFHYLIEPLEGAPHFFLEREFFYDTPTFFVMVPAGQLRVAGEQLEDQGVAAMGETSWGIYAGAFNEGDTLSFTVLPDMMGEERPPGTIERENAPPFHSQGHIQRWEQSPFSGIDAHLFMILVIGVPVGILVWYLLKRRKEGKQKTELEKEEEVFQRYLVREKFLKEKLLELEKKKAEGSIDEEDYAQQLELYKKKLLEVRVKLKQFTE